MAGARDGLFWPVVNVVAGVAALALMIVTLTDVSGIYLGLCVAATVVIAFLLVVRVVGLCAVWSRRCKQRDSGI